MNPGMVERITTVCTMIEKDLDAAMHEGDAAGYTPESQAIIMARIAAAASGLATVLKTVVTQLERP